MIQNKLWLIPIMLLLSLTTIFAVPQECWSEIRCNISGTVPSGTIIYPSYDPLVGAPSEEMCEIQNVVIPGNSQYGTIKIRIQQGGDSGTIRNLEYTLNRTSPIIADIVPIVFYLDKSTTPTYVYCIDLAITNVQDAGFGTEINTINTWVASYGLNYEQFINPVNKANTLPTSNAVSGTLGISFNTALTLAGTILANLQNNGTQSFKIDNPTGAVFDVNNSGTQNLTGIPTTYTNLLYGNVHNTITGTYCGDGFCESSKGEDVFSCIPDCSFGGSHTEFNPISTDVSGIDANVTLDGNVVIPTYSSVTTNYTNYPADLTNPFILGFAWLLIAFGIFMSFSFVLAMFRR